MLKFKKSVVRTALLAGLTLAGSTLISQQTFAEDPKPVGQYLNQATSADELANNLDREYDRIATETTDFSYADVAKDDLTKAKQTFDAIAMTFRKAAASWRDDAAEEGERNWKEGLGQMPAKDAWRRRITEFRRAQSQALPSQEWTEETKSRTSEAAMPAYDDLIKAKNAEAAAWAATAEGTTPEAKPAEIDALRDKALAARTEAEISSWRLMWRIHREDLWKDKSIKAEDLGDALTSVDKLQDERAQLHRERLALEQKVRKVETDMNSAQQELLKKYMQVQQNNAQQAADK